MMKKIISVMLAFAYMLAAAIPAFAEADYIGDYNPTKYQNISYIAPALSISGGAASCKTSVGGRTGTTKIEITMYLQKKIKNDWTNITKFNGEKKSQSYTLSKTTSVGKGVYRIKSYVSVYRNGSSESDTAYSKTASY